MRKELKKWPMKMGEEIIENSILEKYLGDIIHEKGCKESITATINERMRKLIPQCEDIIQIANTPLMGGLRNSKIAFNLFESLVIQPLLHNCASWIGITEKHINELQKFQNKFIRRVLHLPHSVTHAILDWDVGMLPMEWRIKERKLNFVRNILQKNDENICKQTLIQEMETGINGLAHECNKVCEEIDIPEIINNNVMSKRQIKETIKDTVTLKNKEKLLSFRKVADRVSDDPWVKKKIFQKLSTIFSKIVPNDYICRADFKNIYIRASNHTVLPMHALCTQYCVHRACTGHGWDSDPHTYMFLESALRM